MSDSLVALRHADVGVGLDNEIQRFIGIICFHCLPDTFVKPDDILELSLVGASDLAAVHATGMYPERRLQLNVHQCLLPTGDQELLVRLMSSAGEVLSVRTVPFKVLPCNALGPMVANKLRDWQIPWAFFGPCDAARYPYAQLEADSPLRPWVDRPDAAAHVDRLVQEGSINSVEAQALKRFLSDGIFILENAIDPQLIDDVNVEIDDAVSRGWKGYTYGSSGRIEHLHLHYPHMAKLWTDLGHRRWCDLLFGVQARPAQTLTYLFGSQQDVHQDTIHLTTFPPGYMCGVWIALQDIAPDSGELVYYPGSHREPRLYTSSLGVKKTQLPEDWRQFEAKALPAWAAMAAKYPNRIYRPRKGTIAIWHENLLHGGSVRKDDRLERRSVVVHAYGEGALAFADSSGIACTGMPLASASDAIFVP